MWASAPTNDLAGFHDFVGGQGRPPLQPVLENRVWVEKSPRFPFRPPPKTETPRAGADGYDRRGAGRCISGHVLRPVRIGCTKHAGG